MANQPDPHVNPATGVWDDNYYAQTQGAGGNGGGLSAPGNSAQTQQYLNDYHDLVKTAAEMFNQPTQSDAEIMSNVKASLLPNTPVPQAPNMLQEYQTLRADPSVTSLESKLSQLKQQRNTIITQNQTNQAAEEGKPVAMNVIAGRQTQEQKEATIQLDSVNLQMQTVTDELTMRYTMIDNIMKYTQSDFTNAMTTYETQFKTNQAIYDAFNTAKQQQFTNKMEELKTVMTGTATEIDSSLKLQAQQWQEQQDIIKNATANLTILGNMIQSGAIDVKSMSADQKLTIQKLELQAGLPAGTLMSIVQTNPTGKIIYAGANGAVLEQPDGTFKTVSYNVSKGGGSGGLPSIATSTGKASTYLTQNANSYGNVTPAVWNAALNAWHQDGHDTASFINNFSGFTDPNRKDFAQAYGFNPDKRGGVNSTAVDTKQQQQADQTQF